MQSFLQGFDIRKMVEDNDDDDDDDDDGHLGTHTHTIDLKSKLLFHPMSSLFTAGKLWSKVP